MNHNGSFVGRDFKQLVQVFSVILRESFEKELEEENLLRITVECFEIAGFLSSLLYTRGINERVDMYLALVTTLTQELSDKCRELDNYCIATNIESPLISLAPKMHLLHHLCEDIVRFGPAVHFETEHGECGVQALI